jgi:RNA 3'-terminal phosphate cyclase (ATP)
MNMKSTSDIVIDGSEGEGGGQVLRTALALSALTQRPFVLENIRAKRSKPGLMRQHLTCVEAAAAMCGATTLGAALLSTKLQFTPSTIQAGSFRFAVGSAGSTGLVAQTIIPIAMLAPGAVEATIDGGTHVPFAPVTDYLQQTFVPALKAMGVDVGIDRKGVGFYPAGGGRVVVRATPSVPLPWSRPHRGELHSIHATAIFAHGSASLANELLLAVPPALSSLSVPITIEHEPVRSNGPGCVVVFALITSTGTTLFSAIPERGAAPMRAVHDVIKDIMRWVDADVAVDEHLADQLLLPVALGAGGSFSTTTPTEHSLTNARIIERFLPQVRIRFENTGSHHWRCEVSCG